MLPPVGYFDMLYLMKKCRFIITDSGGLQEEATSPKLRKKVLVVRKKTDRPEAVESGFSELLGMNSNKILSAIKENMFDSSITSKTSPYGNGHAGEKIAKILKNYNFKSNS
jgi:UDP-N-acetylglucosamine 2-epimerase (non-hydrolysing)